MKKHRGLARAFLISYFVAIFGGMIFGLLLVKDNLPFAIVMMCVCLADFIAIIVARNLFKRNFKAFVYTSAASFGLLNLLVLLGLILEIIFTAQGLSAPYPWLVIGVSIPLLVIVDLSYIFDLIKIRRKKLIAEGIIKEEEEEI